MIRTVVITVLVTILCVSVVEARKRSAPYPQVYVHELSYEEKSFDQRWYEITGQKLKPVVMIPVEEHVTTAAHASVEVASADPVFVALPKPRPDVPETIRKEPEPKKHHARHTYRHRHYAHRRHRG